jgi:sortase A
MASLAALVLLLSACSAAPPEDVPPTSTSSGTTSTASATAPVTTSTPTATSTSADPPTSPTTTPPTATATGPVPSDGTPVEARLTIPAIGVSALVVQPYEGWTDDAPGTRIQNRGRAASPHGPRGGTGPGGVGNYQVTAHRTTSPGPFRDLPALADGALVHVDAGGVRYTYAVTGTRQTSFRSAASLAEQRAALPGRPGVAATQAMVTLSTCATPEDHAAGNHWADELDNPEHRIDKVGVLVATSAVPG